LNKKNIVILATEGITTNMLFHKLEKYFNIKTVIIENKISKKIILKNRIKKLGLFKVIGQLMFLILVAPFLSLLSKRRVKEILTENNVNSKQIPKSLINKVESVNDTEIVDLIKAANPDLIFVNGTRIISKSIIESVNVKMINIHVGITPKYRGVHGGYWAVYNNNLKMFGTTLHYIDSGVDTGTIIDQTVIEITKKDNYATYPILQYCLGLALLDKNIELINNDISKTKKALTTESHLYYHPTFWQYLFKRLTKNIK